MNFICETDGALKELLVEVSEDAIPVRDRKRFLSLKVSPETYKFSETKERYSSAWLNVLRL